METKMTDVKKLVKIIDAAWKGGWKMAEWDGITERQKIRYVEVIEDCDYYFKFLCDHDFWKALYGEGKHEYIMAMNYLECKKCKNHYMENIYCYLHHMTQCIVYTTKKDQLNYIYNLIK